MASIDFLQKRIDGKKKEIEKLQKKLARILEAQASGWEKNPYWYREDDIRYTNRDIEQAQKALENYENELALANQKAASRNVPAITEFLDKWLERCTKYYSNGLKEAHELSLEIRQLGKATDGFRWGTPEYIEADEKYHQAYKAYYAKLHGYFEDREYERNGRKRKQSVKVRDGELEYILPFMERTYDESMQKVAKVLKEEYNRKYDFIIERTCEIVGTITDATNLRVGSKGDLNGFIIGTDGKAKVSTIGAGGYNIQCYHFRTLIHPI